MTCNELQSFIIPSFSKRLKHKPNTEQKEIIVIECEKPPGCTNNASGASLIRDEFRTKMHSAELGRNQSLS